MKLAVIIATFGRREILAALLEELGRQDKLPDKVVVAAPDVLHIPEKLEGLPFVIECVTGRRGSSAQRNDALDSIEGQFDIITFLDDDFVPARDYLALVDDAFTRTPGWAVVMGEVIKDGACNQGLTWEEGVSLVRDLGPVSLNCTKVTHHIGAYGCNMSVRAKLIGDLRFDERLVLYGWQEDIDFTSQLRRHGAVVSLDILRGVHLGIKSGRVSGERFGYSQLVNPIYLVRKGTVPLTFAVPLMMRNLASNLIRSIRPEPYIDRRGRLRGNLLALRHLLQGRVEPEYIMELST